ncbi:hypothetical protein Ga0074812_14130 [Parafrankia irregularis]|uniref:Guanylate cyclase n=1 Tax=Parafrankia irregularis TaxID=795642 RepID=A0A0S4QZA6_9ACTN|nr:MULTISPECIES: hypothetical protein [Parafrankia]MBE3200682.1 hypothetical protein [Parafrankia sp. CH37]CUU60511.1 hypothetical protein Ga0074812_14130 [Parafrankia irregularis]
MGGRPLTLDDAVELTRTGDVWIFRGRSTMDRAIQLTTNSPVNHVGMAVVLDDLPPLMWHAELGRSLHDVWAGGHHRGVQLHDLREAVVVWGNRYGQRAWLRQLEPTVDRAAEDAVLRTVARLDGTPFPSTARLAGRWLAGRAPRPRRPGAGNAAGPSPEVDIASPATVVPPETGTSLEAGIPPETGFPTAPGASTPTRASRVLGVLRGARLVKARAEPSPAGLESAYCAEVVAVTYEAMGLLPPGRRPNWYDPGRFWSGDDLPLTAGYRLSDEIAVEIPAGPPPRTSRG